MKGLNPFLPCYQLQTFSPASKSQHTGNLEVPKPTLHHLASTMHQRDMIHQLSHKIVESYYVTVACGGVYEYCAIPNSLGPAATLNNAHHTLRVHTTPFCRQVAYLGHNETFVDNPFMRKECTEASRSPKMKYNTNKSMNIVNINKICSQSE